MAEEMGKQIFKVTDPIIEAAANGIERYDLTSAEFHDVFMIEGPDGKAAGLKGGTGFFISSVLGIGGAVGVGKVAGKASNEPTIISGGAHKDTSKPINDGMDSHHCPAKSCYKDTLLSSADGPAIKMDPLDHKRTASYGNSDEAKEYRKQQEELVSQGKLMEAIEMDVDDIRSKFGNKYDKEIAEMLKYAESIDPKLLMEKKIMNFEPFSRVGELKKNLTRNDVRKIFGNKYASFYKTKASKVETDDFLDKNFHVYYSDDLIIKGVEFFYPNYISFNNINLFGDNFLSIFNNINTLQGDGEVDEYGAEFKSLGVSLYAPDHEENENARVESIYIKF